MSELGHATTGAARRADYLRIPVTHSTEEDSWLVTYLDVITLLLVMFVVMLALSGGSPDLSGEQASVAATAPAVAQITDLESELELSSIESEAFAARARAALQAAGLSDDISVVSQRDGVRFRISNDILFGSGEVELSLEGVRQLENLVPLLAESDYQVTVAGHTDSLPIQTPRFPSNWELSSARAGSVVRLFEVAGVARDRLQAAGFADTRPLNRNDTEQARARNRRVEIILEDSSIMNGQVDQGASRR
ncbi:OmpA/MotB family protein [Marinobacter halophilus]|uniref:Flagellar motor protein MotB n=1 Tax=Marinobacter halophilus TaxID=1323740 RepID=A0A2T1KG31_9GAMM|nr:OmpA family protein [Marinobacter halophilus]PSF08713.1 flagellar motor protein MotB [Marinobacter halophilus]GGC63138.1 chemotaxis protein MotB [Marinobacter halophilus]